MHILCLFLTVTIPYNIAPLYDGWKVDEWHQFLEAHKGEDVEFNVGGNIITNHVSEYPIDEYLTYRLIPPSYTGFNEIGIYQRNLTNFDEVPLYRNSQSKLKQCVNCHTYNAADPDEYLFHVRAYEGGTVIMSKKYGARKVDLKRAGFIGAGVYPAWHPSGDYIAFSQNETRQLFYREHPDKIEVIDLQSDLVLYSLADDKLIPIEQEKTIFETFPTWSPDGTKLYSCRARTDFAALGTNEVARAEDVKNATTNLFYDLVVRDFSVGGLPGGQTLPLGPEVGGDPRAPRLSEPRMLVDGRVSHRSVTLPRVSPDGRWLIMTVGPWGQFHIWHHDSDLWEIDLKENTLRPLSEINSNNVESYHTFSSNGRWMVFSSRRDDGAFTRPYFAAFDPETGKFDAPFILPPRFKGDHEERFFSYNVPEFSTGPVKMSNAETRMLIKNWLDPQLRSWHFIPHVGSYILSYLFLIAAALCWRWRYRKYLTAAGLVFMASGLIFGSLWGHVAWGTYWRWDPKETLALITFLTFISSVIIEGVSLTGKRVFLPATKRSAGLILHILGLLLITITAYL